MPKAPNPLAVVFKALNKSLGKGVPVLAFPTSGTPPIWPPIPAQAGGIFGGNTSQFRLYLAPTLTMGLGIAICLGPYGVSTKLPKPFRDIGGNCIVIGIPGGQSCTEENNDTSTSRANTTYPQALAEAATNGSCTNPPSVGNKIVFASNGSSVDTNNKGTSSPFQMTVFQSNQSTAPFVPEGNFGGLIQIDQEVTKEVVAQEENINAPVNVGQTLYDLKAGSQETLKVLGGKTKGLVKCIIKDWMQRQVKYLINNLTKMTVQIDLPDVTDAIQ